MEYQFYIHSVTRQRIVDQLDRLTVDQVNRIPEGFNNNIIWNAVHVMVTQQLLCYGRSEQALFWEPELIDAYRKGSSPGNSIDENFLAWTKEQLPLTAQRMKADYEQGLFGQYNAYETSYGVKLQSVEEAMSFNNTHESLHLGYIMSQRRALLS